MDFFRRQILALGALTALSAAAAHAGAGKDCRCRANGRYYLEGETACVMGHMARCSMFLNTTSWTMLPESCPQSQLPEGPRLAQWQVPQPGRDTDAVCMP
jgi:hypothetical protein